MNKTKTWDIEKEKNTGNKNPSASSNCIERIINQTITYVIRIKISCDENMSTIISQEGSSMKMDHFFWLGWKWNSSTNGGPTLFDPRIIALNQSSLANLG